MSVPAIVSLRRWPWILDDATKSHRTALRNTYLLVVLAAPKIDLNACIAYNAIIDCT